MHQSVLLQQWFRFLEGRRLYRYVDGTLGAAGHAEAVLREHPEIELFIGIDQDQEALDISKQRLESWKDKVQLIQGNFADIGDYVTGDVDAIFLDIGVSSMQLDRPERGFSFSSEGPLDMRMDTSQQLTAELIVNTYSEKELGRIFRDYGEEKRWRRASQAIVKSRGVHPIKTTRDLVRLLYSVLKTNKKKHLHPLTLVFQALRIEVNGELDVLKKVIPSGIEMLRPSGIMGIITFHSLEDRIVKRVFRQAASDKEFSSGLAGLFIDKEPEVTLLTRKPVIPEKEEIMYNPRARSAKLRVAEKR